MRRLEATLCAMSTRRLPKRAVAGLCLLAWLLPGVAAAQAAAATPQAQAAQVARAWAEARARALGARDARIEVALLPAVRRLPDCPMPWRVEGGEDVPAEGRFDRLQVLARCPGTGGEGRLVVRVQAQVAGVVVREAVAAGQPLQAGMLALAGQDLAAVPDLLLAVADAEGRTARRSLRPGQPLRRSLLQAPVAVRRGQPVRIVGTGSGFQVAVAGTALEDGAAGDTVRIRNASTGRATTATVLGPGLVGLQPSAPGE